MNTVNRLRRRFLQGSATVVLAPFFARLGHAAVPVKRIIIVNTSNGTLPESYWPARASETDFTLGPILAPLADYKGQMIVAQGLDAASGLADKPSGEAHYNPVIHALTGGRDPGGRLFPSLDQVIGEGLLAPTPAKVVNLGVQSDNFLPVLYKKDGAGVRDSIDPVGAYGKLLGAASSPTAANQAALDLRRSILDVNASELQALRRQLPGPEGRSLEEHLAVVRESEQALKKAAAGPATAAPVPACQDKPVFAPLDLKADASFPLILKMQTDLIASLAACDVTRVITLNLGSPKSLSYYSWLGINREYHAVSHHGSKDFIPMHLQIETWHASQIALLLGRLGAISDGQGGTLFDGTVLFWQNNMSTGLHSMRSLPWLVVAGKATGLRTGRHLKFEGRAHSDMLLALTQAMGVKVTTFGAPEFNTGPVALG